MTKSTRNLILTTVGVVSVAVAIMAFKSPAGKENIIENQKVQINLNKTLTNEMSDTSSLSKMDAKIEKYMAEWNLKGVSLSIMRQDSLVYSKGYGWADKEQDQKMGPGNILRVASVSKLITATGIMILQERGMLSLSDTVFGPRGILCDTIYTQAIKDKNYYRITVEDLLRHKGGFTNGLGDPMFSTRTIILQNHLKSAPDHQTLVPIILKRKLGYIPGTSQSYSNFGYLLLSMIIEKVSGMDYEEFMQKNVLRPIGCTDMHIAGNYYKDKYKNEVRYYMQSNDEPVEEYNNSRNMVTRCYGGNDIPGLSGAGAWVCSTAELAKFVAAIDGKPEFPDLLSPESVHAMTEYFDESTYSLGWNDTKPTGEWSRTGSFSGTTALVKYYPDGECWIMVANTSTWRGSGQTRYTSSLFNSLRESYSDLLPHRNFFYEEDEKEDKE